MLFNSIEFLIFFPVVLALYWSMRNLKLPYQNSLLLVASYFFYGWWDWRFLSLIIFSSLVDFMVGLRMEKSTSAKKRKALLLVSIMVNIGFLGFFKYFNFFADSFSHAFTLMGQPIESHRLNIILPVGISFYTFQTLSYTIDIYRGKMKATRDPLAFFAFVSFFPQLVAGPIERATNLLPQFSRKRKISYEDFSDGARQILWGFLKKVVIADNAAVLVNEIFGNHEAYGGATLILGAVLFAFQIYGDFSAYSDIAIGTARIFGFSLMRNFAYPYFSRDIAEFWRRWHISLSTWFRDYVYIPMGGSRGSTANKVRNTMVVFLVSGFWHGANWTFLAWGALNALYFLPSLLLKRNRRYTDQVAPNRMLPSWKEALQILSTFSLTTFAWIFFRAENLGHATSYIGGIFRDGFFNGPGIELKQLWFFLPLMLLVEWMQRNKQHGLQFNSYGRKWILARWSLYILLLLSIYLFGNHSADYEFIYFQF